MSKVVQDMVRGAEGRLVNAGAVEEFSLQDRGHRFSNLENSSEGL